MFGLFKEKEVKQQGTMTYAQLYQFMLNNISAHCNKISKLSDVQKENYLSAFDLANALSVALCKPSEEILVDIVNNKPDYIE